MDRLSTTEYNLIAAYMCFLILVGGFIQIVTLLVLIRSDDFKTKSLTPYLINIGVANMVMVAGSFPSTLASAIMKEWPFSDYIVCRLVGFLGGIAAVSMIATMTCITFEIYTTVNISCKCTKLTSNDRNLVHYKVILAVWLYSVFTMLPPLAGWTRMIKESACMNCTPNWKADDTSDLVYVLLLTSLAYILPVSIAGIYLWKIRKAINQHIKKVSRISNPGFSSTQKKLQGFRKISKMAGLAIAAFTITWLPYCVYVFISVFGGSHLIGAHTGLIAALVAKSSILYSPFIYAFVNPRFRVSVMILLKIKRTISSIHNAENNVHVIQLRLTQLYNFTTLQLVNEIDFRLPSYLEKNKFPN